MSPISVVATNTGTYLKHYKWLCPLNWWYLTQIPCNLAPGDLVFKMKLLEGSCFNVRLLLDLNILVLRAVFWIYLINQHFYSVHYKQDTTWREDSNYPGVTALALVWKGCFFSFSVMSLPGNSSHDFGLQGLQVHCVSSLTLSVCVCKTEPQPGTQQVLSLPLSHCRDSQSDLSAFYALQCAIKPWEIHI